MHFSGMIVKFRSILVSVLAGTNLCMKSRDLKLLAFCVFASKHPETAILNIAEFLLKYYKHKNRFLELLCM